MTAFAARPRPTQVIYETASNNESDFSLEMKDPTYAGCGELIFLRHVNEFDPVSHDAESSAREVIGNLDVLRGSRRQIVGAQQVP
jgi:hypothetical protein